MMNQNSYRKEGKAKPAVYFHQVLVSRNLGGAGIVALRLAQFFHAQNRPSYVWVPGDGSSKDKAQELNLVYREYDAARLFHSSKVTLAIENMKIGRLLRRQSPGILHVHSPFYYKALHLGLMISGLKSVAHVQIEEGEEGLRWAFQNPPNVIITCARFLVDHVRRALPEPYQVKQKIIAIPNAVDTERFYPGDKEAAKERVGALHGMPLALIVANLAPHKGQETAMRAIAILKQSGINIALWIVGGEREQKKIYTTYLFSLSRELGVDDRVHLVGHREDIPALLQAADFFLLPSEHEGLPLALLEAQATKVVVLAAPTAGIPEVVIDGETGFLVGAKDSSGYADCLSKLLLNPTLYSSVTEKAYTKIVEEYNWKSYCEKIQNVYEQLLSEKVTTGHNEASLM